MATVNSLVNYDDEVLDETSTPKLVDYDEETQEEALTPTSTKGKATLTPSTSDSTLEDLLSYPSTPEDVVMTEQVPSGPSKPKVVLDRSYTGLSTANENQALLDECTDLKFQIMTLESSKFMDRGIIEHKTQELVMAIQVKEAVQEQAIKDRDTSKKVIKSLNRVVKGLRRDFKNLQEVFSAQELEVKTVDNLQEELRRCYQQMDSLQKELDTTYKPVVAEAVEEKDFQDWRQNSKYFPFGQSKAKPYPQLVMSEVPSYSKAGAVIVLIQLLVEDEFFRAKRKADDAGSVQNAIANFLEVKSDSLTVEKAYQAGAAAIGAQLGLNQDYANKKKTTFDAKEIRRENKRKQQQRDESKFIAYNTRSVNILTKGKVINAVAILATLIGDLAPTHNGIKAISFLLKKLIKLLNKLFLIFDIFTLQNCQDSLTILFSIFKNCPTTLAVLLTCPKVVLADPNVSAMTALSAELFLSGSFAMAVVLVVLSLTLFRNRNHENITFVCSLGRFRCEVADLKSQSFTHENGSAVSEDIKKAILLKLNEHLNKRYSYTPTNFTKAVNMVLAAHIGRDGGPEIQLAPIAVRNDPANINEGSDNDETSPEESIDLTRSLLQSLTMQTATLRDIQSSLGSQTSTHLGFTTAGNVNPVETVHNLIELAVTKYGTERRAHQDLADAKSDLRAKVLTLENATEWRIDVERVYSEHKSFFNNNLDSFVKSFVCALAFTDSGNVHLFKLTIKDDPTWSNFETAWKTLIETPTAVAAKARSLYNFKFESGDAIVESTRLKTLNSTLGTKKSNNDALKHAFASGLAEYDKFYWGKITKPFRVHRLSKLVSLEDPDVTLEDVANFLYEKGMSGDSFHRSGGASSPVDRGLDQVAQLLSKRDQKINDKFNDVSEQVKSLLSVVTPLVMQQKRVERETRDVSRERDRRPGTEAVKVPYRPQRETLLSFLDTDTPLNDWNETAEAALEVFNMSRDEKDRFKSKFRPQSVLCSLCKRPGHMHADCPDVKEFLEYKRLKDSTSAGGNGV
ncbi:hypothetical protein BDR26DRAFT_904431 [Obelidium mucronatum]|nr:hypothetical protein BDR26DRAFT_904431 [Obelidium mucronatum]